MEGHLLNVDEKKEECVQSEEGKDVTTGTAGGRPP